MIIRPATLKDHNGLSSLINYEYYVHRHLDWRSALDWLGSRPFWVIERSQRILAALAIPTNPPEVSWVRLFAVNESFGQKKAWEALFPSCLDELKRTSSSPIAALGLNDWFAEVLVDHQFRHFQDIVVLSWDEDQSVPHPVSGKDWSLRPMRSEDIPAVAKLDHTSFERLWQISTNTLEHSFDQSGYSTVIEMNGRLVGYQISSSGTYNAHLARLAVLPSLQRQHLGYALVQDLQDHFRKRHARYITVNTQNNNLASLALYQKMGFRLTGEYFPVYAYYGDPSMDPGSA
jgi:ribosomal protein S18 acetylase RimI-like enzyme